MALPTFGSNPRYLEELKVGGGYNSTPDGGTDIDATGNIAADGDITIDGNMLIKGNIGAATFDGDMALGTNGVNKIWSKWIPVSEMGLSTSSPPAVGTYEASEAILPVLDFDQTTTEFVGFSLELGQDYDGSVLKFTKVWTAISGTGAVAWTWEPYVLNAGDALGTAATDVHHVATLSAVGALQSNSFTATPSGAATGSLLYVRLRRNTAHGSDTLNADARLIGVSISYA